MWASPSRQTGAVRTTQVSPHNHVPCRFMAMPKSSIRSAIFLISTFGVDVKAIEDLHGVIVGVL